MSERHRIVQVWFFVGVMLAVYGALILASGLVEWSHPPAVELAELHAPVWWGTLLLTLGAIYCYRFRPRRG